MKLLLIEDDLKIAEAVRRGLEAEGFTVDVVHDGDDGYWRASEGSYDLIVLDLMLPTRNGWRICADLRADANWTPILMLTAKGGEWDEAEGLDCGADDYLVKPFSFPVLVARVRALIRRHGVAAPPSMAVGRLRLDPAECRAWYDTHEIGLTAREFQVLEFMVRRSGRVLSKSEILDGVWSDEFEGDPNIVEVYVARIRRKLDAVSPADAADGAALISTVRGSGYRVEER